MVYALLLLWIKCDFRSFIRPKSLIHDDDVERHYDFHWCVIVQYLNHFYDYDVMWFSSTIYFNHVLHLWAQMLKRTEVDTNVHTDCDWYCMSFGIYIFIYSENYYYYYCIYFNPSVFHPFATLWLCQWLYLYSNFIDLKLSLSFSTSLSLSLSLCIYNVSLEPEKKSEASKCRYCLNVNCKQYNIIWMYFCYCYCCI